MDKPKFFYQKCEDRYPGYVALMAQFLPTFDAQDSLLTSRKSHLQEDAIIYQDDGEEI